MTLPFYGAISLSSLKGEFGGNASPKLSEYYKGKGFNQAYNPNLPSSGPISLSNFYGSTKHTNTTFKSSGGEIVYSGTAGDKIVYPNGVTQNIVDWNPVFLTRMAGIHTIIHSSTATIYLPGLAGDGLTEIISITNSVNVVGLTGQIIVASADYINITTYGRPNLTTVPTVLPENITILRNFFCRSTKLTTNITGWDVSRVTDMSNMFENAFSFNQAIGSWNVSKVTDMSGMFQYVSSFNQPLGSWNVEKVTKMDGMFKYAASFNQPLNKWCVENIPTEPTDFAKSANKFQTSNKPIWGSCTTTVVV